MEAALASGLLKVAGPKLVSLINSEFAAILGVQRDLSELQDIHGEITSWLSAVRDREIESELQFRWVIKLKYVAYDIDDLLQQVQLEAEKQMIERDGQKNAISSCLCAKPKAFAFRYKMARKIKAIKLRFAAIVKQRSDINTLVSTFPMDQPARSRNRIIGEMSLFGNVEESKIPQRDQERDEIISKLVESNAGENATIISIVGLGGSGKTTLAKHICHDVKIKEHFKDAIFWVHVSQEFYVQKLIGKLFETIVGENSDRHPHQHMVQKISKELSDKMFLLILDDAWHEDRHDWEQFMVQLKCGAPGTRMMLTTRDRKVAETVESRHIFELSFLSDSESWSLFLKGSGWVEQDLSSDYVQVGKEIIKRCGGVPLAIKTLGAVLHGKMQIGAWRAIRDNNLWNVESINDRVFASLKLSYIHLSDELKQCFTYCSIFPKGYKFRKDRLIRQWIAHGFINAMNGEKLEDIGSDYFESLVKVSFFQDRDGIRDTDQLYTMHDLIHDLTRQILHDELVTSLPINTTKKVMHRCRYLSLNSCIEKIDEASFDKVRALYVSGSKPSFDTLVKNSRCMRSVVLDYETETPSNLFILKFEYLGYLEVHNVSCTEVPEGISSCWNLQSLYFVNCKGFVTLPESIGNLRKLRSLELHSIIDLESLPQSIGDCQLLQSLQIYYCAKLREMPSSLYKFGNLCTLGVVRCSSLQQLPPDIIGELKNLRTISFKDCTCFLDLPSTLSCHSLYTLNLSQTKVTMLPQWVTSIGTLECIDLRYCRELVELPKGIGNLKRLAVLNIEGCSKLRRLPSGMGQLTRLRKLGLFVVGRGADDAMISELENLDLICGTLEITNLKYLRNPCDAEKACLKRKNNIEHLRLDWSLSEADEEFVSDVEQDWGVMNALEPPSQIKQLIICGYRGLFLPQWMTKQEDSSYCEGTVLKQSMDSRFHCLIRLSLEYCPNLMHMQGLPEFPSLDDLELCGMPNLEELRITAGGGFEIMPAQQLFPVLSSLSICDCPKLIVSPYFPPWVVHLSSQKNGDQLLTPGRLSHHLLPPPVIESSLSCSPLASVPQLKNMLLMKTTGSSSVWEFLQHSTKLEGLFIFDCNDLTNLPESMRGLISLQTLQLEVCPSLDILPDWLGELHSLRHLMLTGMDNLKQLPEAIQHLTSLEHLNISCRALTMLPEGIGQLFALRRLSIQDCPNILCLPQSIQRLTALEELEIDGCPCLAKRYKERVGPDWHIVSHISRVRINV